MRWALLILLVGVLLWTGCDQPTAPVASRPLAPAAPADAPAAEAPADEAPADEAPAATAEPAPPAQPPAAPKAKQPRRDLTFDDLKFEMEKTDPFERSMLTPEIEALVGQPIRIRGYIRPTPFQTGITQFVLVRDNLECCFGPGAWLYDCVLVEMNPGKSTEYTIRPVAVEGVFEVREFMGPDGKHLAIYHLQADRVE